MTSITNIYISFSVKQPQYHYHQPSDEYQDSWDLSGFKDHLEITRNMVLRLANSEEWPEWYEGNEFKAIREASKEIKSN